MRLDTQYTYMYISLGVKASFQRMYDKIILLHGHAFAPKLSENCVTSWFQDHVRNFPTRHQARIDCDVFFILLINWAQKYWQIRVGLIGLRIDQFIMVSRPKVQVTCHCGDGFQFELKTPARQLLLPWNSWSLCDVWDEYSYLFSPTLKNPGFFKTIEILLLHWWTGQ